MPQPSAVSKFTELVRSLNDMLMDRGRINEFNLKRIEKDARQLPEVHNRFVIYGMISCLRNDIEDMHHHHKNAIRLMPSSLEVKLQYYVSLRSLNLNEEAYELCKAMYEQSPETHFVLYNIALMASKTGDKDNVEKYLSELNDLLIRLKIDDPVNKGKIFMIRHGIKDEVKTLLKIAEQNFSSILNLDATSYEDPETGEESVSINLVVDSDVEQFLKEYSEYTDKFIQNVPTEKRHFIHLNYAFA